MGMKNSVPTNTSKDPRVLCLVIFRFIIQPWPYARLLGLEMTPPLGLYPTQNIFKQPLGQNAWYWPFICNPLLVPHTEKLRVTPKEPRVPEVRSSQGTLNYFWNSPTPPKDAIKCEKWHDFFCYKVSCDTQQVSGGYT
jgi:hypothetical protein